MKFFAVNIKILKISGLWVPLLKRTPRYYVSLLFNATSVFYSIIFFTIAEFIALKETASNKNDLVENLNMAMSFLLTFFKVSIWFFNRKEIVGIMQFLSGSAKNFVAIEDFDPDSVVEEERKVKDALTYTFFILAFTVPTSACALTFVQVLFGDEPDYRLPYHSYVPFDYTASKLSFGVAVVYQCLALLSCGTITVGFDMLYTSIVSFTSAHFILLQGAFSTIKARCLRKLGLPRDYEGDVLDREMEFEMSKCIQHLQLIVGICERLESIFTYLVFLQMLISLIVFCTCLYIVSSMPIGTNILGNQLAYMLAIENQLMVYCYAGNKLTLRGEGIPFSLYDNDWFAATKKFKQNMIMTMMRMNKPILLTAGKFSPLNLATFVTIGRGSYSLLAVLQNR